MFRKAGSFSTNRQACRTGRLSTWWLTMRAMTLPTRNAVPCTRRSPRLGNRLRQVDFDQHQQFWTNCASGGERWRSEAHLKQTRRSAQSTNGGAPIAPRHQTCLSRNWPRRSTSSAMLQTSAAHIDIPRCQVRVACCSGALGITSTTLRTATTSWCLPCGMPNVALDRRCAYPEHLVLAI